MAERGYKDFLAELAAPTAAPGGGSASALAGALGAALAAMVGGISQKKAAAETQAEFRDLINEAGKLRAELEALIEEDARAFVQVMEVFRLPKETPAEKEKRKEAIQSAFKKAVKVPLQVMDYCLNAIELAMAGLEKGNPNCSSDAGVGILLAHAGLKGAAMNVRINLPAIKDEAFNKKAEARLQEMLCRGDELKAKMERLIEEKI